MADREPLRVAKFVGGALDGATVPVTLFPDFWLVASADGALALYECAWEELVGQDSTYIMEPSRKPEEFWEELADLRKRLKGVRK